jgi:hypothetical protein
MANLFDMLIEAQQSRHVVLEELREIETNWMVLIEESPCAGCLQEMAEVLSKLAAAARSASDSWRERAFKLNGPVESSS